MDVDKLLSAVSVFATIVDCAVDIDVDKLLSAVSVLRTIVDSAVDKAVERAVIDEDIVLKLIPAKAGVVVREDLSIPEGIAW